MMEAARRTLSDPVLVEVLTLAATLVLAGAVMIMLFVVIRWLFREDA